MAFIRVQKLVRDGSGNITSGSAAIKESRYVRDGGKFHSRQIVRERLGKVVWLSPDGKSGIFLSPQRGLVAYDSASDTFDDVAKNDKRLRGPVRSFPESEPHTVFGDAYLLMNFLVRTGMAAILKEAFPDGTDRQRVLCHILHGILRDGSGIDCDCFMEKSFASHILDVVPLPTLRCDTLCFEIMGADRTRTAFFQAFVGMMQRRDPGFGRCCYLDSVPLPDGTPVPSCLVLLLDKETELPLWYDVIPGSDPDRGAMMAVADEAAGCLDIAVSPLFLNTGFMAGAIGLSQLPSSEWTAETVRGMVFGDILNTIILLNLHRELEGSGLSVSEIIGRTQSLMCIRNRHGEILVEKPGKKVKAYYKLIGATVPASLKISDFQKMILSS